MDRPTWNIATSNFRNVIKSLPSRSQYPTIRNLSVFVASPFVFRVSSNVRKFGRYSWQKSTKSSPGFFSFRRPDSRRNFDSAKFRGRVLRKSKIDQHIAGFRLALRAPLIPARSHFQREDPQTLARVSAKIFRRSIAITRLLLSSQPREWRRFRLFLLSAIDPPISAR